jgi:hypothetical protein
MDIKKYLKSRTDLKSFILLLICIILRCFPGCYGGPNPTSHRAILERASDIVSRLADGIRSLISEP